MRNFRSWAVAALLVLVAGADAGAQARRGWLGITYDTTERGSEPVTIDNVHPDSPAERAGVRPGDQIVRWNGRADVRAALRTPPTLDPGERVQLRLRRAGERDRDVTVVAADRPTRLVEVRPRGPDGRTVIVVAPEELERELRVFSDSLARRAVELQVRVQELLRDSLGPRLRMLEREIPDIRIRSREAAVTAADAERDAVALFDLGRRSVAGAEFAEMNSELSDYFGTSEGALVLRVAPETPAARAGLQAGDVVLRAGGAEVESAVDLRRALSTGPQRDAREVQLEVLRKGSRRELTLRWE